MKEVFKDVNTPLGPRPRRIVVVVVVVAVVVVVVVAISAWASGPEAC